jgi:hypothetical protein
MTIDYAKGNRALIAARNKHFQPKQNAFTRRRVGAHEKKTITMVFFK